MHRTVRRVCDLVLNRDRLAAHSCDPPPERGFAAREAYGDPPTSYGKRRGPTGETWFPP
jgi:hypothetical protein